MSGIPGLFNRSGRPADAAVIGRMIAAAPHRGRDHARCWTSGPVAIGYQPFLRLPEDVVQPVVAGTSAIAFDGRIDNRTELLPELFSGVALFRTPSDAELALAAYEQWGVTSVSRLLGDFAYVIWDGRARRVVCARDVMGIKPFYYAVTPRQFVWGSDLRQILASGAPESVQPNEGMIAEYLAKAIQSQDETLYRGVMRLPAAHTMVVTADQVQIARYWKIDTSAELALASDDDYAGRFYQLFRDAVSCRLRGDEGPAAAYLSGGLDSSSVVGMMTALGRSPETYSLVFPGVPEADESRYIDAVVDRFGLTAHKTPPSRIEGTTCRAHVMRRKDTLDLPADLASEALMSVVEERGTRIVLTGVGGDYCFTGSHLHYADLLREGNLIGFARRIREDWNVPYTGWSLWQPLMSGVRPLIPRSVRRRIRAAGVAAGVMAGAPDWIEPAFAGRVALADRLATPGWVEEATSFSRRGICERFASGWQYLLLEHGERSACEHGFEERHPFFDRRLIEFGVALPESQRWRGAETKFVMRRAMRNLLPRVVAERQTKGNFAVCVARAVDALGDASFFETLHIASLGWVKREAVRELYRRSAAQFRAGDDNYADGMFKLWMIGGIELWYRSFLEGHHYDGTEEPLAGGHVWPAAGWRAETQGVPATRAH
ncbi:MAG TPA: asparagine synthase-related protein [Vicinamibacterales bacterium]|jgi:asparagine synthase (glutamine-hydrolysing)|nr:asparagine synthase-related protein [Vicinamibacterales bacterium]